MARKSPAKKTRQDALVCAYGPCSKAFIPQRVKAGVKQYHSVQCRVKAWREAQRAQMAQKEVQQ